MLLPCQTRTYLSTRPLNVCEADLDEMPTASANAFVVTLPYLAAIFAAVFPEDVLERCQRVERALVAAVAEISKGNSKVTRKSGRKGLR